MSSHQWNSHLSALLTTALSETLSSQDVQKYWVGVGCVTGETRAGMTQNQPSMGSSCSCVSDWQGLGNLALVTFIGL